MQTMPQTNSKVNAKPAKKRSKKKSKSSRESSRSTAGAENRKSKKRRRILEQKITKKELLASLPSFKNAPPGYQWGALGQDPYPEVQPLVWRQYMGGEALQAGSRGEALTYWDAFPRRFKPDGSPVEFVPLGSPDEEMESFVVSLVKDARKILLHHENQQQDEDIRSAENLKEDAVAAQGSLQCREVLDSFDHGANVTQTIYASQELKILECLKSELDRLLEATAK